MRYRLDSFFARAGTRDHLALPLRQFFHSSGYARSSCVTAWTVFSLERAREIILRYRLDDFFPRAGTRDLLALPLRLFFHSSGYARSSCVTASAIFSLERVCETLLRYRLNSFFTRAGMRALLALPLGRFFPSSGYARASCVTAWTVFSLERAREIILRYRLDSFFTRAGMRGLPTLPFSYFFKEFGHDGRSNVTFLLLFQRVRA